jgi:hypothetical protein
MFSDLDLAIFCNHAYIPGETHLNGMVCGPKQDIRYDKATYWKSIFEVEAVSYRIGKNVILSMRGTEFNFKGSQWYSNWLDLIRDVRFLPWRTKYGWGHSGFCKGAFRWLDVYSGVFENDCNYYLTGHSMGAQLVAWLALAFPVDHSQIKKITLFAEPKGFFQSSREFYSNIGLADITTSYINENDFIKSMPPWGKTSVTQTVAGKGSHAMLDYLENLKDF